MHSPSTLTTAPLTELGCRTSESLDSCASYDERKVLLTAAESPSCYVELVLRCLN
jgi:hypothetical protein